MKASSGSGEWPRVKISDSDGIEHASARQRLGKILLLLILLVILILICRS
jgi:hypothetical protein